jgi:hypothetical protein
VEVQIGPVDDSDAGVALVRSGDADVIHVPPSYEGPVDASVGSGVVVAYALNAASPRLASVGQRRALVDAIDVAEVASSLAGLEPPGSADAGSSDAATGRSLPAALSVAIVGMDADRAADFEPAAGVDAEAAMAAVVASQWSEVGVEVGVDDLSLRSFVALVSGGAHEVIRSGWVDLYPGDRPHWRLVDVGSGANVTGVGDPELALQMRRAGGDVGPAARAAVEDAIADLSVLLPIGRLQVRLVTAPGVDFVVPRPDGALTFVD